MFTTTPNEAVSTGAHCALVQYPPFVRLWRWPCWELRLQYVRWYLTKVRYTHLPSAFESIMVRAGTGGRKKKAHRPGCYRVYNILLFFACTCFLSLFFFIQGPMIPAVVNAMIMPMIHVIIGHILFLPTPYPCTCWGYGMYFSMVWHCGGYGCVLQTVLWEDLKQHIIGFHRACYLLFL